MRMSTGIEAWSFGQQVAVCNPNCNPPGLQTLISDDTGRHVVRANAQVSGIERHSAVRDEPRRAGFRFLCPKGCAGSSPASPTQGCSRNGTPIVHTTPSGRALVVAIGSFGASPSQLRRSRGARWSVRRCRGAAKRRFRSDFRRATATPRVGRVARSSCGAAGAATTCRGAAWRAAHRSAGARPTVRRATGSCASPGTIEPCPCCTPPA